MKMELIYIFNINVFSINAIKSNTLNFIEDQVKKVISAVIN